MVFKHDPNITDRNEKALKVPCSYCKAPIGQPCWTLRSKDNAWNVVPEDRTTYAPHKHRIRAAWGKQYKERVKEKG